MHWIITTFTEAVIKVEVANFGAAMDTLIDEDAGKDKRTLHTEESSVSQSLCFAVSLSNKDRVAAFSHEWAEYPSSLFQPDNSHPTRYIMRKGNKPDYLTSLQNATDVKGYHERPESGDCTSLVINMMAFIKQYMDMGCKTFQELQHKYLMTLLSKTPRNCNTAQ